MVKSHNHRRQRTLMEAFHAFVILRLKETDGSQHIS